MWAISVLAKITHRPRKLCAERALMQFNCTYLFVRITKFRSQHKYMFIPDRISSRMKWATICKLVKCCRTIIAKSYVRLNKHILAHKQILVRAYIFSSNNCEKVKISKIHRQRQKMRPKTCSDFQNYGVWRLGCFRDERAYKALVNPICAHFH